MKPYAIELAEEIGATDDQLKELATHLKHFFEPESDVQWIPALGEHKTTSQIIKKVQKQDAHFFIYLKALVENVEVRPKKMELVRDECEGIFRKMLLIIQRQANSIDFIEEGYREQMKELKADSKNQIEFLQKTLEYERGGSEPPPEPKPKKKKK
jgi:hypothetical protein